LRDPDTGEFVNPDREHNQNAGTNAINYRNSPFYHRDDEDPAYVHSSQVHGDPETPILEAYEGDKIRFRLFQGSWEEQHNFDLSGLRFDPEGFADQDMVSQVIGTSEAFTFTVRPEESQQDFKHITNPDDLPVRDYRYGSNVIDDMWTGMGGCRVSGGRGQPPPNTPRPGRAERVHRRGPTRGDGSSGTLLQLRLDRGRPASETPLCRGRGPDAATGQGRPAERQRRGDPTTGT